MEVVVSRFCVFCVRKDKDDRGLRVDEKLIEVLCQQLMVNYDDLKSPTTTTSLISRSFPVCSECNRMTIEFCKVHHLLEEVKSQLDKVIMDIQARITHSQHQDSLLLDLKSQLLRKKIIQSVSVSSSQLPNNNDSTSTSPDQFIKTEVDYESQMDFEEAEPYDAEDIKPVLNNVLTHSEQSPSPSSIIDLESSSECSEWEESESAAGNSSDSQGQSDEEDDDIKPIVDDDDHSDSMQTDSGNEYESYEEKVRTKNTSKVDPIQHCVTVTSKSLLKCELCHHKTVTFNSSSQLKSHYLRSHKSAEKTHICSYPKCGEAFCSYFLLDRHFSESHSRFSCVECRKSFNDEKDWNKHQKTMHPSQPKPVPKQCPPQVKTKPTLICHFCDKTSTSATWLRNHETARHIEKLIYECQTCMKMYSTQSLLEIHRNTHSPEAPFICPVCKKLKRVNNHTSFYFSQDLEKHLINFHAFPCAPISAEITENQLASATPTSWICELCNKNKKEVTFNFKTLESLKCHLRKKHESAEKTYSCSLPNCKDKFSAKVLLESHLNCHKKINTKNTDKSPSFYCKECNKTFNVKEVWERHQKLHTLPSTSTQTLFQCRWRRWCIETSLSARELRKHEIRQHSDQLKFVCEICFDKYSSSLLLNLHQKTHSPQGPYECSMCNTTDDNTNAVGPFNGSEDLQEHLIEFHAFHRSVKLQASTKWPCEECGRVYPSLSRYERHKEKSHEKRKEEYICGICPEEKKYLGEPPLVRHYMLLHESVPETEKTLVCPICDGKFATNVILDKHVRNHKFDKTRPITCKLCLARLQTESQLDLHNKRRHAKDGLQLKVNCNHCTQSFNSKKLRLIHERKYHPEIFIYKCTLCDKAYSEQLFLDTHAQMHAESLDGSYTCHICNAKFIAKDRLAEHFLFHTGENHIMCKLCPQTFLYEAEIKDHMKNKHADAKPHECPTCGKKYALSSQVRKCKKADARKAQGLSFDCKLCPKKYLNKISLNDHHRFVHEKQEHRMITCEFCGKMYKSKYFSKHVRFFHSNKVEMKKCSFCQKEFKTNYELNLHMLIHTGEKPFTCHVCQKGFTQKHSLKSHLNVHRSNGTFFPKPNDNENSTSTATTTSDTAKSDSSNCNTGNNTNVASISGTSNSLQSSP